MKVFVTGASGFIGERIVEFLLKENFEEIRLLIRKPNNEEFAKNPRIKIIQGSLSDVEKLKNGIKGTDYVIHSAALASDWGNWSEFKEANIDGTKNIMEACLESKNSLRGIVYVSTVDVYGYPIDAKTCTEDHPIVETSLPYNKSKAQGEKLVWEYINKHQLPIKIVRPTNVYGPKGTEFVEIIADTLIDKMMMLVSGGLNSVGLVYVDNVASAIVDCLLSEKTIGEAYNIADNSGDISWKEYNHRLAKSINYTKPVGDPWINLPFMLLYGIGYLLEWIYFILRIQTRPLITRHAIYLLGRDQYFPNDKSKRDFGYKELFNFEEGLKKSADWYNTKNMERFAKK